MTRPRRPSASARPAILGALALALALTGPVAGLPADAAADDVMSAARTAATSCFAGPDPDAGHVDTRQFRADVTGTVRARLTGTGDWDLAVYDVATGAVVAGSAGYRTNELAEGFVTQGQRLTVQACRYAGSAPDARLRIEFVEGPPLLGVTGPLNQIALLDVLTPTRESKARLQSLGLDLTESGGADRVGVLARNPRDLRALTDAGLTYTVVVPDLVAVDRANRLADARAAEGPASDLPSGATSYRRLFDYQLEMKQLAAAHPGLVRLLRLPHPTVEGRDVEGIEITRGVDRIEDGKPVFLQLGLHHAREWPSGELVLEFAHDLVRNRARPEIARLLSRARTIVVPVVNPDGFTISREAPAAVSRLGGENYGVGDYEYKRKNCRPAGTAAGTAAGACGASQDGAFRGTDVNRNYGGFWGGPGASVREAAETYRGTAPFSEPETRNVAHLISTRPVSVAVTNHTYGNLVLRPPGMFALRPSGDEPLYRELGDRAARHNGFVSQFVHELYDVTGSLEDWSYWNAGTLTYTFEIGAAGFHPAFADGVIAEYLGRSPAAGAGRGGNRAAFFSLLRAAADRRTHAVVRGRAPAGVVLRLHKQFTSRTSPVAGAGDAVAPLTYRDELSTVYRSRGGAFAIAVNPSTRPLVADRYGRDPIGPPQDPILFTNPPPRATERGIPPDRIAFRILGPPAADNGSAVIAVSWLNPLADWDLLLQDATGAIVGSSISSGTTSESIELLDPAPGHYTATIVDSGTGALSDWHGGVTFARPPRPVRGAREAWTLTCETPDGKVLGSRRVVVDRGRSVHVGRVCGR